MGDSLINVTIRFQPKRISNKPLFSGSIPCTRKTILNTWKTKMTLHTSMAK